MDSQELKHLLESVASGKATTTSAFKKLSKVGYEDIGFAKVDHHRAMRQGFCEVIYCSGKTPRQVATIAKKLLASSSTLLATRADKKIYAAIKKVAPKAKFHKECNAITVEKHKQKRKGRLLIVTAGTTDIPVAEEAAVTADIMGCNVERVYDVGVAGIHRLLNQQDKLRQADCIIAVAGMDGALPSVIGGMVNAPVVAVPTSVGYGAAFGGVAPLLTMLNSCATGVAVTNIDNGFGAGAVAARIIWRIASGGEDGNE